MMNSSLRKFVLSLAVMTVCAVVLPVAAHADDSNLDQRLDRLERELSAVQRKVFGGSMPSAPQTPEQPVEQTPPAGSSSVANLDVRVSDLESQLAQTTGQVEVVNHKLDLLEKRLDNFMKDTEFRLNALENKGGGGPSSANPAATGPQDLTAASPAPASPPAVSAPGAAGQAVNPEEQTAGTMPRPDPAGDYNRAYGLLSAGKYGEAEQAFSQFLKLYPDNELAANAQYWLAQTFYVRGNYDRAAKAFLTGYQKYPKSPKAAAYLLKIGITLTKIGQKQDACDVFRELRKKFPNSTESKSRRPEEEKAAGCK